MVRVLKWGLVGGLLGVTSSCVTFRGDNFLMALNGVMYAVLFAAACLVWLGLKWIWKSRGSSQPAIDSEHKLG